MRLRFAVLFIILIFFAGCSTDDPTRDNPFVPLTSIEVSSTYDVMADKTVNQYKAEGDFSGQFKRDITDEVSWRIPNRKIAMVSNSAGSEGLVTAEAPGEATIEASQEGIFASAAVIVSDAELTGMEITPQDEEISIGLTLQYMATGTFSDDSEQDISILVDWQSSDTAVVIFDAPDDPPGLATAVATGTSVISGTWEGITAQADLQVATMLTSITISPAQSTVAKGTTEQFSAEGEFSDGSVDDVTDTVDWQSIDDGIGTVNTSGVATGVAAGTTDITASIEVSGDTIEDTAELTVTNAVIRSINITPENPDIAMDENQQFTATGVFSDISEQDITELATWLTTNNSVGTISNTSGSRGLFTSTASGTTFIEANFDGITGTTHLDVN